MRYLKHYENFIEIEELEDIEIKEPELSGVHIDDFLSGELLKDSGSYMDNNGVWHIKNWKEY